MAITFNSGNVSTPTPNISKTSGTNDVSPSPNVSGTNYSPNISATSNASTFTLTYTAYVPNTGSVSVTGTVIVSSVNTPTNSVTASPNITATAAVVTTTSNAPKTGSTQTPGATVTHNGNYAVPEDGKYVVYDNQGNQVATYDSIDDVPSGTAVYYNTVSGEAGSSSGLNTASSEADKSWGDYYNDCFYGGMPGETLDEKAEFYWQSHIPTFGERAPDAVAGNKFVSSIYATWKVLTR